MYFSRYSVSIQGNLIRPPKERASWANRWCTSQKPSHQKLSWRSTKSWRQICLARWQ
ncbi:hypothetical protein E5334_04890 [Muricaecibacterium torontonense]|uniref:Uncharacterized protein n=1 Tax=Muricaecibacterium torontonense TaxID=3032871 RepID=A0A4V3RRN3_9ACTN|nr:hypothetical protein E5334_04890 [Muricaecibacterium torontonense]